MTAPTTPGTPMATRTVIWFFALAFGQSWGVATIAVGFADQLEPIFGPLGLTNPRSSSPSTPQRSPASAWSSHTSVCAGCAVTSHDSRCGACPLGGPATSYPGSPPPSTAGRGSRAANCRSPSPPGMRSPRHSCSCWRWVRWRSSGGGVALPLLQRRFRPIWADLILSTLWAIWHLPAFLLSGTPQSQWSFPVFFIGVVSISYILTPLFNAASGSILIAAV